MYKRSIILMLSLILSNIFIPTAFAEPYTPLNSIYNDAKFEFKIDINNGNNEYTATVTRKDNDFNDKYVLFIFNIILMDKNRIYPTSITRSVLLLPNKNSNSIHEKLNPGETITQLKENSYGIKFPPFTEIKGDASIPDTAFNLRLKYRESWLKHQDPCVDYYFYRRDNKPMDCKVVLRRSILEVYNTGKLEKEWISFIINPKESSEEGFILNKQGLKEIYTQYGNPGVAVEEYYFQFVKEWR